MLNEDFPRAHGIKVGQKAAWEAGAGVGPGLVHSALPQTLTYPQVRAVLQGERMARERRAGRAQGRVGTGALS